MKSKWIIGRKDIGNADILFDDASVSGIHGAIEVLENKMHLSDLNSTNGTIIKRKDKIMVVSEPVQILNDDQISFGKYEVTVSYLKLQIQKLSHSKQKKKIYEKQVNDSVQILVGKAKIRCQNCGRVVPDVKTCIFCKGNLQGQEI